MSHNNETNTGKQIHVSIRKGTHSHLNTACRVAGRPTGLTQEGSTSAALLNRDDVSVGPSEDEESALLPNGTQRRQTNGSLDSIFERMESQPVGCVLTALHGCFGDSQGPKDNFIWVNKLKNRQVFEPMELQPVGFVLFTLHGCFENTQGPKDDHIGMNKLKNRPVKSR